jgi:hypothetical protein
MSATPTNFAGPGTKSFCKAVIRQSAGMLPTPSTIASKTDLEGRDPDEKTGKRPEPDPHVVGYDPDVFRRLPYAMPKLSPHDRPSENSHLSRLVTTDLVNKIIVATVLKDHRSGGITMSLKDLSHGFVNNVARSHMGKYAPSPELDNTCGTFIPEMVSLEPLRQKVVLLVMDALIACYEGGPGTWNNTWDVWEKKSLFFCHRSGSAGPCRLAYSRPVPCQPRLATGG